VSGEIGRMCDFRAKPIIPTARRWVTRSKSVIEGRVKSCLGVLGVEALTVERNAPLRNRPQCRIDVAGSRKKPMELERQKRIIAGAAAFIRRPAHEDQHSLKLRLTTGFVTPGLCRKPFCRFRKGDGAAAREPLAVIEPDFKLDPHGKRMIAQSSVIDEIGNLSIDRCTKAISKGRRLEQGIDWWRAPGSHRSRHRH
jgi:hypothetical protein